MNNKKMALALVRSALALFVFCLTVSFLHGQGSSLFGETMDPDDAICLPERNLDYGKVYVIIVGVLEWPARGLGSFPTENRKDQELYDTLVAAGVPRANRLLILDGEASLANVRRRLGSLASRAPEDATFIFYYAGHGIEVPGDTCMANHDVTDAEMDDTCFRVGHLGDILEANLRAQRVLLLGDYCFSGAMSRVASRMRALGKDAACLASVLPDGTSTRNWTYTQTLIEAFRGDPLADRDGDGYVTLGEMQVEVRDAMRYLEEQESAYTDNGLDRSLRLALATGERPSSGRRDPKVIGLYVDANRGGRRRRARIVGVEGDLYVVRFYDYSVYHHRRLGSRDIRRIRKTAGRTD